MCVTKETQHRLAIKKSCYWKSRQNSKILVYPKTVGTGVSAGQRPPYHLIFVCCPLEHALGPLDVEEDVGKDPDGILVATHHQICKTDIIVCGDLALGHAGIHALWKGAEAASTSLKTNSPQLGLAEPSVNQSKSIKRSLQSPWTTQRKPWLWSWRLRVDGTTNWLCDLKTPFPWL